MSDQDALALEKDSSCSSKSKDLDKDEDDLVEELKKICDKNGKELEPTKSAAIFHQLAKVYQKRRPELLTHRMICLVKSAALFNAAIVRSDNLSNIENNLKDLCSNILNEANAQNKDADLIAQAYIVAVSIRTMREKVAKKLNELRKIPHNVQYDQWNVVELKRADDIEELLTDIAHDYTNVMAGVAKFSEEVMGETPCEFSLAGMGSLARREVTPYSDFENMILLNTNHGDYEHMLNYFRWYSVIFQIVLINLKETIIPSVSIHSLNDKNSKHGDWFYDDITTRGICFDGMMPHACKFPLGRQHFTKDKQWATELIKPVNKMLKFLNSEESMKNGYHLSTILTKTCHVYGNVEVFKAFEKGVRDLIEKENQEAIELSVKKQITEDLGKFATRQSICKIKPMTQFNVKLVMYRSTTMLIAEFGRLNKIHSNSCFDILRKLSHKTSITASAKQKLMFAVAIANEIRLRWYIISKRQRDNIGSIKMLFQLIGKKTTLRYLQIAYALQCDISKRLHLKKVHLYSYPNLLNVNLAHFLNDNYHLQGLLQATKENSQKTQRYYSFDECFSAMVKETGNQFSIQAQTELESKSILELGEVLMRLQCYDDAYDCFQQHFEMFNCTESSTKEESITNPFLWSEKFLENVTDRNIAQALHQAGYCLVKLSEFSKAEIYFEKSLKIKEKMPSNPNNDLDVAKNGSTIRSMLLRNEQI